MQRTSSPWLGLCRKHPLRSLPHKAEFATSFQELRDSRRFLCSPHLVQGLENLVGTETCVGAQPDLGEGEGVLVNVSELAPAVKAAQVSPGLLSFQKKPQIYELKKRSTHCLRWRKPVQGSSTPTCKPVISALLCIVCWEQIPEF